jgi:hypothetical protein
VLGNKSPIILQFPVGIGAHYSKAYQIHISSSNGKLHIYAHNYTHMLVYSCMYVHNALECCQFINYIVTLMHLLNVLLYI